MYRESLDERLAKEHFMGKTREEAKELIKSNFSYYVEDLAEEDFVELNEESADTLFCIVSMLEMRRTLNGNNKEEPLKAIGELLSKSKEFCERSMQDPAFQQWHKQQQRLIISPSKKLVLLEKQYFPQTA